MENGDWQMHKSLVECNRLMLEKQVLILIGPIPIQDKINLLLFQLCMLVDATHLAV